MSKKKPCCILSQKFPFDYVVGVFMEGMSVCKTPFVYRTPFVDGTSSVRSSSLVALSSAFATPLKIASDM